MTRQALVRIGTANKSSAKNWLKVAGLSSLAAIAVINGFRWSSQGSLKAFLTDVYTRIAQAVDWRYHWWRLPLVPAIAVLLATRAVYQISHNANGILS